MIENCAAVEKGDIIIDGGHAHFPDTIGGSGAREQVSIFGTGVSGGEEGALNGPRSCQRLPWVVASRPRPLLGRSPKSTATCCPCRPKAPDLS